MSAPRDKVLVIFFRILNEWCGYHRFNGTQCQLQETDKVLVMFFSILDVRSIAASVVFSTKYPIEQISTPDNCGKFQLNISKDLITTSD
ncbi:hypothetical protein PoB_006879700 [Plakobranchus ocellatus]|uniref:Uncharacterized protein n=1 Tax=Plakobranchus ocellatus TaxID=259542 RepID=A0AAV4DE17_9GAST|nr:hypothetical protein PoB_006879700 [Plakobranchus ocellatus]